MLKERIVRRLHAVKIARPASSTEAKVRCSGAGRASAQRRAKEAPLNERSNRINFFIQVELNRNILQHGISLHS